MIKKLRRKFICMNLTVISLTLIAILCTVIYSTSHNLAQNDLDLMLRLAQEPPQSDQSGLPDDRPPEALRQSYLIIHLNTQGAITATENVRFSLSDDTDYESLIHAARNAKTSAFPNNSAPIPDSDTAQSEPGNAGIRNAATDTTTAIAATNTEHTILEIGRLSAQQLRFLHMHNGQSGETYVFLDISGSQAILATLARNCLFIGLGAFVIFFAISVLFARWAVRPVENAWEDQKQFIADASHELKTPLTIILTNAQLLRSPDFDETQKQRFSDNILDTATRMRTLIEGLLDLSRADRGMLHSDVTDLNFSELVEQQLCIYEPIYFEHGLTLQQELADDIHVSGSPTQLTQVLDILLDNADKYALPASQIRVKLNVAHHNCLLSVTTAGEPLSARDQVAIFKRFYRVDQSHSDSGSYGLGLSIADTIVRAHHGEIYARSGAGENTFFVRLPLEHAQK